MKAYRYDRKRRILVETDQGPHKGQGVPAFFPLDGAAFYQRRQRGLLLEEFMGFTFLISSS